MSRLKTGAASHPVDLHVGMRLRKRRHYLGLSQKDVAEAVDVTFQQIQKYESGANRISASMLMSLAQALNMPVSGFFEGFSSDKTALDG